MNPHSPPLTSPIAIAVSLWRNRSLIKQMTKREVVGRYRGSIMGLGWSLFNPLLMLSIYTLVFSTVFKTRWGMAGEESKVNFAIVLFVGMIVHSLFAECINRAPSLIVSNVNYVKKVVFPLEVLPIVAMGSALFHAGVSVIVLILAMLLLYGGVPWTAALLPVVLLPLLVVTLGFAWLLASLGAFVRDIAQTTGIITTVMMFLSPVFYPISALPEAYQAWLHINPLTFVIVEARKVIIFGQMLDWAGWILYLPISLAIGWAGFWWFQKTRKGFADVV